MPNLEHNDLYGILHLDKDKKATYTKEDIKEAFKRRALKVHPDKGGAKEEFVELKKAYCILSDPNKKKLYDENKTVVEADNLSFNDQEMESLFNSLFSRMNDSDYDYRVSLDLTKTYAEKINQEYAKLPLISFKTIKSIIYAILKIALIVPFVIMPRQRTSVIQAGIFSSSQNGQKLGFKEIFKENVLDNYYRNVALGDILVICLLIPVVPVLSGIVSMPLDVFVSCCMLACTIGYAGYIFNQKSLGNISNKENEERISYVKSFNTGAVYKGLNIDNNKSYKGFPIVNHCETDFHIEKGNSGFSCVYNRYYLRDMGVTQETRSAAVKAETAEGSDMNRRFTKIA